MRRRGRCAQDVEYQRPVLLPLLFPAANTHETRGCERPVPRTDPMRRRGRCAQDVEYQRPVLLPLLPASTHSRTPSFLTTTTLSAPAFGRTFNSTYLCRSLPVPSRRSVCPPRMCVVADTSRHLRMRRRAPSYEMTRRVGASSLPWNQVNRPGRPAPQLPYPPYNR